jgi:hypothetical protein
MMILENKYDFEQIVYLKTDPEQLPRIVTRMTINKGGLISYALNSGPMESYHYEFEISQEKNVLINLD